MTCDCGERKPAIGGYFELADQEDGVFPHPEGILLNTGRNALEYILRSIGEMKRIYLPFFTCDAVLEPLKKLQIPWTFYHIDKRFELARDIHLQPGEYLIANNYFGLKDEYLRGLANKYGARLIVDCAQSFLAQPIPGIHSFYSPRKFVGVADGGIAYLGSDPNRPVSVKETDNTDDHDSHLLIRKQEGAEAGFSEYRANEQKLAGQPIRRMSDKTQGLLGQIDYDSVAAVRRANFAYLHHRLREKNLLTLSETGSFSCPMAYPFLTDDTTLKQKLIADKVFVATYWPNVLDWCRPEEWEYRLADCTAFLPVDQRYGAHEMERILSRIDYVSRA